MMSLADMSAFATRLACRAGRSGAGRDEAEARVKPPEGCDASSAAVVAGAGAAGLVLGNGTTAAIWVGASSRGAGAILAAGWTRFGGVALATRVSGPLAITRASCASGSRGQCRTLPTSIWMNGAPELG